VSAAAAASLAVDACAPDDADAAADVDDADAEADVVSEGDLRW
jgi:hypothetical protein